MRKAEVVRRGVGQRLEVTNEVVAEVADEAARQGRQVVVRRRAVAGEELGSRGEGIVVFDLEAVTVLLDRQAPVRVGDAGTGAHAKERVAAHVLALFRAL